MTFELLLRRDPGTSAGEDTAYQPASYSLRLPPAVPDGFSQRLEGDGAWDRRAGRRGALVFVCRHRLPPGWRVQLGGAGGAGEVSGTVGLSLADLLCGYRKEVLLDPAAPPLVLDQAGYAPPPCSPVLYAGRGLLGGDLRLALAVEYPAPGSPLAERMAKLHAVLERVFRAGE